MNTLRTAGFFSDLPYGDPTAPRLADAISRKAGAHEHDAVEFLKGGATLLLSPSVSYDVFEPTTPIGTLAIHTDGTWAWPADLAYYVERYHCSLPRDMVEHMRKSAWSASPNVDLSAVAPPAHLGLVPAGDPGPLL